ncbi:MAG: DNA methyltransferase [Candidatus Sumerlaeota bacterium]|nr:DNA methyltransferase [Candidatus Sumerlaeota bacterium]
MSEDDRLNLTPEWRRHPKSWGHSFHPMCSYMAMFPARIPHYFIQKFTRRGDVALDPFCGRGTTPLQACAEGRVGIGVDLNPLAWLLTAAKVDAPDKDDLLFRVEDLQTDMFYGDIENEPPEIRMLFHDYTLSQLSYLKGALDRNDPRDRFLLATLTGILHGATAKDGRSSHFLSISMPNTFSMSPNYIRTYVEEHELRKVKTDVFDTLRWKIERLYRHGRPEIRGYAHLAGAQHLGDIPNRHLKRKEVKLVVSSPPYLKVVRYGLYNWIRLWLLGEDPERLDQTLDQHPKLDDYLLFMHRVCQQLYRVMLPGGVCALVIGDVKTPRDTIALNLAEAVWKFLKRRKTRFELAGIIEDELAENTKVTKIWGADKRGRATLVDRVLVLAKGPVEVVREHVTW